MSEDDFVRQLVDELDARDPGAGTRMLAVRDDAADRRQLVTQLRARRESERLSCADIDRRLKAEPGTTEAAELGLSDPRLSTLQRYARALGGRLVTDIEMPEEQP